MQFASHFIAVWVWSRWKSDMFLTFLLRWMVNQSDLLPTWCFSSLLKKLYVKLMTKHEQSQVGKFRTIWILKRPHIVLQRLYIELFWLSFSFILHVHLIQRGKDRIDEFLCNRLLGSPQLSCYLGRMGTASHHPRYFCFPEVLCSLHLLPQKVTETWSGR